MTKKNKTISLLIFTLFLSVIFYTGFNPFLISTVKIQNKNEFENLVKNFPQEFVVKNMPQENKR